MARSGAQYEHMFDGYLSFAGDSGGVWTKASGTGCLLAVIDPGHGQIVGADGKLQYQRPPSPTFGLYEDNLTLSISATIASELAKDGVNVLETRTGNLAPFAPVGCGIPCFVDIKKRREFAEKVEADLLVSVHTNAGTSTAHGTETYFSSADPDSSKLASDILSSVVSLGLRNRGTKSKGFNILLSPDFPSSLIEAAFHTNSILTSDEVITDEALLNDPINRASIGILTEIAIRGFIADVFGQGN